MEFFKQAGNQLVWSRAHETVVLEPWGTNGLRVRATRGTAVQELPGALLPGPQPSAEIAIKSLEGASIRNGQAKATMTPEGRLVFSNAASGKILLEEEPFLFYRKPARDFKAVSSDLYHIEVKFLANNAERLYGLGQHTHGFLDQKGCVIELAQRNTQVSIPFLVSNLGYAFLWNNPAIGRVELGRDLTRWVSDTARQVDYAVTISDNYPDLLAWYADVTGHAPLLPQWAAGFWQCKLRYKTQEELLQVAREYKRRGLPLSIIVVDFFHWTMMGEWQFDPKDWPDPAGMVRELEGMGVKLMVSVWSTVNPNSRHFEEMNQRGWLVRSERGIPIIMPIDDTFPSGRGLMYYYDATHPEARQFVWEQVRQNYYRHGIKVWWLDACEPEFYPTDYDHLRYHLGNGLEVGNLYPMLHESGFYEGMRAEGETEIISLCRSAWAGSQRYGAAVWSGDIASTFEVLQQQVRAGLNLGLSGIPWWTTDIGGFHGGDLNSPTFRELIVRWFQFGVFCPLFRLHGYRSPSDVPGSGGPNEIWSFGDSAYPIIRDLLFLRERMKPYLMAQMATASQTGAPPMRPLFYDFPQDPICYQVEDQFMLGPQVLVAPVLFEGDRQRQVYLPAGLGWRDAWTDQLFGGGQWVTAAAPLDQVPVYFLEGSHPFDMIVNS